MQCHPGPSYFLLVKFVVTTRHYSHQILRNSSLTLISYYTCVIMFTCLNSSILDRIVLRGNEVKSNKQLLLFKNIGGEKKKLTKYQSLNKLISFLFWDVIQSDSPSIFTPALINCFFSAHSSNAKLVISNINLNVFNIHYKHNNTIYKDIKVDFISINLDASGMSQSDDGEYNSFNKKKPSRVRTRKY
ncbi:hypothetical protein AGLY_016145 [Aphis glycines]|uniref:Uncharacterized protein n=1 Tax=Aphis glycines TaxID=307491 RepID=A0A6G0SYZ2_APHGL|nr:hypothetical protein AGLY_016145 [Aphis glycines]